MEQILLQHTHVKKDALQQQYLQLELNTQQHKLLNGKNGQNVHILVLYLLMVIEYIY